MIRPARALLIVAAIWGLCAISVAMAVKLLIYWYALGGFVALWALIDLFLLYLTPAPAVERRVNASLPVGVWSTVELFLSAPKKGLHITVFDHLPPQCEHTGQPATFISEANKATNIKYRIKPLARGNLEFARTAIRLNSPLGAWQRQGRVGKAQTVHVYPNFAPLTRHALQATDTRQQAGQLKRRRRGQGMDFDQLREYREGDSMRQIDWKATTRMGKVISREYQDERDQRIILMVDCGRRMGARETQETEGRISSLSHFDYALDAVLMLAYVGLRHGDSVGLTTLGGYDRFLSPQRSPSTISRVLHTIYDLQPTLQSSDFELAAQQLITRERKRSLIVLFTNLRDEDDQSLLLATRILSQRHLVLVASLRELSLDQAHTMPTHTAADAALRAAAAEYRAQREAAFARLRANGVLCMDVQPQQLAVDAINRYLSIKSSGRL